MKVSPKPHSRDSLGGKNPGGGCPCKSGKGSSQQKRYRLVLCSVISWFSCSGIGWFYAEILVILFCWIGKWKSVFLWLWFLGQSVFISLAFFKRWALVSGPVNWFYSQGQCMFLCSGFRIRVCCLGQKGVLFPLETDMQSIVDHQVSAGNQTQVFCKRSKSS